MNDDDEMDIACMEQSNKFKLDSDLHTMIVVGIMWEKFVAFFGKLNEVQILIKKQLFFMRLLQIDNYASIICAFSK